MTKSRVFYTYISSFSINIFSKYSNWRIDIYLENSMLLRSIVCDLEVLNGGVFYLIYNHYEMENLNPPKKEIKR